MIKDFHNQDSRSQPIRVLHVDDERSFLEITEMFLQRKGYNFEITRALSAEHGLEKLENEDFDVVISDYQMPVMNGLKFMEELRKTGNETPFILLTGKGEEKVAMDSLNKGASRYVTKKVGNPSVLFDTLGQYILEAAGERETEKEREAIVKEVMEKGRGHHLILALKDRDWNVRMSAAEALGKIKDARAVDHLIQTLKDEDEDVKRSAAEALGKIGSPRAIEPLIQALKDKKELVRASAAEALAEIGEPAVGPLIYALDDEEKYVRMNAAWALGELKDARAIEPLIHALKDEHSDVQWGAAAAIGEIGDKRAVEPLIHALHDDTMSVRCCAAEVLGELKDKRAVEALIQALYDWVEYVRSVAAWSLGEMGDKRAIEPLIQALRDKNESVRKNAAIALGRMGQSTIEPLISALRDKDTYIQKGSADALGAIGDKRAIEPLIQALRDKNEGIRKSAADALGRMGVYAVDPLISALRDKDPNVQKGSADALGELGDRRALEPLVIASEASNEVIGEAAKDALEKIRGRKEKSRTKQVRWQQLAKRASSRKLVTKQPEGIIKRETEVKLTPNHIKEIRELHAKGYRDLDIARRMGISQKSVTKHLKEERIRRLEKTYLQLHRVKI